MLYSICDGVYNLSSQKPIYFIYLFYVVMFYVLFFVYYIVDMPPPPPDDMPLPPNSRPNSSMPPPSFPEYGYDRSSYDGRLCFPSKEDQWSSTVAESHKKNRKIRQKIIFWEKIRFFVIHTSNHCMAVFDVTLRTYCCSAITSMRACSLSVAGKFYKATPTYPLVVTQCALLPCLHFCICLFCLFFF